MRNKGNLILSLVFLLIIILFYFVCFTNSFISIPESDILICKIIFFICLILAIPTLPLNFSIKFVRFTMKHLDGFRSFHIYISFLIAILICSIVYFFYSSDTAFVLLGLYGFFLINFLVGFYFEYEGLESLFLLFFPYKRGLRLKYYLKKRLPKFICKHCFKTIIVKNFNITCPFCDASFLMTDNQTQFQIGDVKVKGMRNLVDESTMERVLFKKCPACGSKIQFIDCYHCGKEINLFESYNERELERKRYE